MSFEDEDVPSLGEFRQRVDQISSLNQRDGLLIKILYLCAARVSEVLTKATPYDLSHTQTKPYGTHLQWKLTDFDAYLKEGEAEKVLLIKSAVAKRSSKDLTFKIIALPCNPEYEPWTLDLLKSLLKKKDLSFPLTRHRVLQILRERLGKDIFKRRTSGRRLLNPLRHFRITHLSGEYGFSAYELTVYAGWTFKTGFGRMGMSSGQLDTYLHPKWKEYFPKLLKPLGSLI